MGLTYTGPRIDYTIADQMLVRDFVVYDYQAGVELDWTLGLRLPVEVGLAGPAARANDQSADTGDRRAHLGLATGRSRCQHRPHCQSAGRVIQDHGRLARPSRQRVFRARTVGLHDA